MFDHSCQERLTKKKKNNYTLLFTGYDISTKKNFEIETSRNGSY